MATSKKKPAKSASVRELAAQPSEPKPRRLRQTASRAKVVFGPIKFLGRIGSHLVPPYFKNSWRELKQVTWPSRKETWQLTFAVFIFAIIFGALIAVTDYGLDKIFRKVLLRS